MRGNSILQVRSSCGSRERSLSSFHCRASLFVSANTRRQHTHEPSAKHGRSNTQAKSKKSSPHLVCFLSAADFTASRPLLCVAQLASYSAPLAHSFIHAKRTNQQLAHLNQTLWPLGGHSQGFGFTTSRSQIQPKQLMQTLCRLAVFVNFPRA